MRYESSLAKSKGTRGSRVPCLMSEVNVALLPPEAAAAVWVGRPVWSGAEGEVRDETAATGGSEAVLGEIAVEVEQA